MPGSFLDSSDKCLHSCLQQWETTAEYQAACKLLVERIASRFGENLINDCTTRREIFEINLLKK